MSAVLVRLTDAQRRAVRTVVAIVVEEGVAGRHRAALEGALRALDEAPAPLTPGEWGALYSASALVQVHYEDDPAIYGSSRRGIDRAIEKLRRVHP